MLWNLWIMVNTVKYVALSGLILWTEHSSIMLFMLLWWSFENALFNKYYLFLFLDFCRKSRFVGNYALLIVQTFVMQMFIMKNKRFLSVRQVSILFGFIHMNWRAKIVSPLCIFFEGHIVQFLNWDHFI